MDCLSRVAGRGDPPDRQRLRRRRHRRHRLLPRLRHPPDRAGALRRQPRLRDRHRHAVGRRRHRPGPAPDRRGAGDRPHRLREGARDGAGAPRAPHRRGGDRGRPAAALAGPHHRHRLHGPALPLLRADARRTRAPSSTSGTRPRSGADPTRIGLKGSWTQVYRLFSPSEDRPKTCEYIQQPRRADRQDRGPLPAGRARRRGRRPTRATSWTARSRPTAASSGSSPSARATASASVSLELLGKARQLADSLGERVGAVLPCDAAGDRPAQLIAAGADIVYVIEHPLLGALRPARPQEGDRRARPRAQAAGDALRGQPARSRARPPGRLRLPVGPDRRLHAPRDRRLQQGHDEPGRRSSSRRARPSAATSWPRS